MALFGFSWSITDSFILIAYILVLIYILALYFLSGNIRFSWRDLSLQEFLVFGFFLWRLITSLVKKSPLSEAISKNLKFVFDVSPVFFMRKVAYSKHINVLLITFLVSLSLITILGILEFLNLIDLGLWSGGDMLGFHRNRIKAGFIWSLGLIVALAYGLKINRAYLVLTILMTVGLFFAKSRGYYLGGLSAITLMLFLFGVKHSFRFTALAYFLIASTVGLVLYLVEPVRYRFLSIVANIGTDNSIRCRLFFWEEGLKAFKESPLFGIGYRNWSEYISGVMEKQGVHCPDYHAHNMFIHTLAETGLIGLLLLVAFIGFLFYKLTKLYFDEDNRFRECVYLIAVGALTSLSVGGFFEPADVKTVVLVPAFSVVGLALGVSNKDKGL